MLLEPPRLVRQGILRYLQGALFRRGCSKRSLTASLQANDVAMPMGEYKLANGQTSTWYQGVKPTPAAQRPAASSKCAKVTSVAGFAYRASFPSSRSCYEILICWNAATKKATVARVTKRHVGAEHA